MGFVSSIERSYRSAETGGRPGPLDDHWYTDRGQLSAAGIRVTPDLAMTLSAVWQAITIRSEGIASLPCITYRRDGEKRTRWPQHPIYSLLRRQPNGQQTAFEFWEMQVQHLDKRGNAYARILEGPRGFADQLVPLHPDRVTPRRLPSGRVQYEVRRHAGAPEYLTQDEVFHLKARSDDGLTGQSVLTYATQSLGTALALQRFQARFFAKGTTAAFAVIHPDKVGPDRVKHLGEYVRSFATGLEHAFGVLPLGEGVKIEKLGMNLNDAQLAALLEASVHDVARWFNMPVHLLRESKTPTFASIEQFDLELVMHTFRPIAIRIEQAIMRDLILAPDIYFSEFLLEALLRADSKARAEFYQSAIQNGWMTRNEVRIRENLNPGGEELDEFWQPKNIGRAGDRDSQQAAVKAERIVREACARLVRTEIAAVTKLAQRHANDGAAWGTELKAFYGEHAERVCQILRLPMPIAREYAGRQGWRLAQGGVAVMKDWEFTVTEELASLAVRGGPELGEAAIESELDRMAA